MKREVAAAFLRRLHSRAPHDATMVLTAFPSRESVGVCAGNVDAAVAAAEAIDGDGQEAYFMTCLLREDFDVEDGFCRGKKADVKWGTCLWVDVDVAGPGHKADASKLPPTFEDAAALLDAVPYPPAIVVDSGGGLHAYWTLAEPWEFGRDGALSPRGRCFVAVVGALQQRVREAAEARGWLVDQTSDATRILRVPGTLNRKIQGQPRPVEVVLDDGEDVRFELISAALGVDVKKLLTLRPERGNVDPSVATPAGSATTPAPTAPASSSGAVGGVDLVVVDALRAKLAEKPFPDPEKQRTFAAILAGESFADSERDRAMQRAISTIAFVARRARIEATPEEMAEVLRASLLVWASEQGAMKTPDEEMAKAVEKARRAKDDADRKAIEREERNKRIAEKMGLTQPAPPSAASPPSVPPTPPAALASGGASARPPVAPGYEKFTDDEVAAICDDLGCSGAELCKRWIIQHKSAYFVLVDGRYKAPLTERELDVSLTRDLARAPVEFWTEKGDGSGVRKLKVAEILQRHATVARRLVASLAAQRSWYDARTETFTEAVCPVRDLDPLFDQDVDDWLRAFGGQEADKLLDWVATLTELDSYTCALYLSGPPETGKTLLAGGVARLWTEGGPSELGRVLENFNEDLMRCPLVFADEHLPTGFHGKRNSAELRSLIGNNKRTLNRKFLPQAPLVGAIRLVLAANNERMLAFNEELSSDDFAAVSERFLHVRTGGAQGFFKARFPGGKAPRDWVEGDAIPRHALWLRDNRLVSHVGRFLVAGSPTRMHQLLATGGRNAPVVEWLAKYLSAKVEVRKQVDQRKLVQVGDGRMLVNTQAIAECWDLLIKNERCPTTTRLGRTLAALSKHDFARVGNQRFREVDVDLVLGWAEENQIGDVEQMRALVNRALPKTATPAPAAAQAEGGNQ